MVFEYGDSDHFFCTFKTRVKRDNFFYILRISKILYVISTLAIFIIRIVRIISYCVCRLNVEYD